MLEVENVLANFGDAAASEKLDTMGDGWAEPGLDFWTRPPALGMPVDRILLRVWSGFPAGDGIPGVYEALLIALEFKLTGRFCRLTAMLDV